MKTKILLADDHKILREGLKSLFEKQSDMEVIGEASDGITVRQLTQNLKPDFILMDISMPGLNGMAVTHLIKKEFPHIHIIGLSVYCERHFILGMLKAGAEGYLVKNNDFREVINAMKSVLNGYLALGKQARKIVIKDYQRLISRNKPLKNGLSDEEQKVIHGLLGEKSISQLAEDLDIDQNTVNCFHTKFVREWLTLS